MTREVPFEVVPISSTKYPGAWIDPILEALAALPPDGTLGLKTKIADHERSALYAAGKRRGLAVSLSKDGDYVIATLRYGTRLTPMGRASISEAQTRRWNRWRENKAAANGTA